MEELKPCPFCGGEADMRENKSSYVPRYYVCCGNVDCWMLVSTCNRETPEQAAELWNRRAET